MARKPVTLAAFEVAPAVLRFVEMTRDERRVLSAASIPLDESRWLDREHLAAQARSLFAASVRGRPNRLIASVPARHAHLRIVDAPAEGADEYLAWDMERYLARPREDYALAFTRVPTPAVPAGTGRYVAAGFDRGQATFVRDALAGATRLPLATLDVDAAAIVNAGLAAHPDARKGRALLVQAERHAASAMRLQDGAPEGFVLAREIENGGAVKPAVSAPENAQERAEALLRRAHAIRDALRGGGAAWETPERAWLCGELAASEDFRELLRAQTGITFRLLNPFANLPGPDPADFPGAWPGAPYTVAVGLALRLAEES